MKKTKKPKKLIYIFIHYLGVFSIIYFFMLTFVGNYLNNFIASAIWADDYNISNYQSYLESGKYDEIPSNKVFGSKGYFDILDKNLNTVYSSNDKHTYTSEDLKNILDKTILNYTIFNLKDNQKLIMDLSGINQGEYYVLDDNYTVISTNTDKNITSFNKKDIENIENVVYGEEGYLIKQEFINDNKNYYIVSYESKFGESYSTFMFYNKVIYAFYIISYLIGALILVHLLNKKINKPLDKLSKAIISYADDRVKSNLEANDISELNEITQRFKYMTKTLDETEKENQEFQKDRQLMLANISHDLKTPITVIQGYSKAIVDKVIKGDEIIAKSQLIYDKTCYLNELVNNFSEFSKLEHPSFTYSFKDVDIAEFIRNYLANKYDEIESKNIDLVIHIPEEKIMVKIDAQQFNRVLDNIINNAIKYGGNNTSIKVVVDNNKVMISNSGTSIEKSTSTDIFKPFSMGDESRNKGGSGLGLSIVKKIVEDHGFSISLMNDKKGFYKTNFIINLNKI